MKKPQKEHHSGTNGGAAYQKRCREYALSVRFQVELAYLTEGSFAGAARELNRKRQLKTMYGKKFFPATVQRLIELYAEIDKGGEGEEANADIQP